MKKSATAFRFLLLSLGMVGMLAGCGGQQSSSSDNGDDIIQADTANVDIAPSSGEALPTVVQDEPVQETKQESTPESTEPVPVAASEPAPEPTPDPVPPAPTGEVGSYTVKRGDTLMKIAFEIYGDIMQWNSLYSLNQANLGNPNQLTVGSKIKYRRPATEPSIEKNGDPYKIKPGDTLGSIAYDIYAKKSKWKYLYENNRTLIKNPNKIYAGFYLYYQITEQERQEADRIRGGSLGTTPSNAEDPNTSAGGDGLSALSGTKQTKTAKAKTSKKTGDRAPASTKAKKSDAKPAAKAGTAAKTANAAAPAAAEKK